ncbi:MAG: hypothetical protein ACOCRK_06700 [bacterium]
MQIGLIDADLLDQGTRFPNLALMKISGYYKKQGHNTKLLTSYQEIENYDKVFLSKVFTKTQIPVDLSNFDNIEYGGTGFDFDKREFLNAKIEHHYPDYNLYTDYVNSKIEEGDRKYKWKYYLNFSIGYLTRFCVRQCSFCVNRNKTKVEKWSPIEEFYNSNRKYLTFLDDNILAYKNAVNIIKEVKNIGKKFEFKQGLDIRFLKENTAKILTDAKYYGDYIFAFDDWNERNIIIPKIKLWRQYCNKSTKFYVLVAYKGLGVDDIIEAFKRINVLMKYNCLAYIMRYKKYEDSEYRGMYINLARWCNQPSFYKKKSFREFCEANGENSATMRYLRNFESKHPEVANQYFDMKYEEM